MRIVRESLYNFHKTGDVKSGLNIGIIKEIKDWLDERDVGKYTINDDYTIDVDGNVWLDNMGLTEFPPFIKFRKIKRGFYCFGNILTTLRGCPEEVGMNFNCSYNRLTTLEGAPKKVGGYFNCCGNLSEFTEEEIREICNVGGSILSI